MLFYFFNKDKTSKGKNELTNPEFAALMEKQHLKECEEHDYVMLERLFQARCSIDETDDSFEVKLKKIIYKCHLVEVLNWIEFCLCRMYQLILHIVVH